MVEVGIQPKVDYIHDVLKSCTKKSMAYVQPLNRDEIDNVLSVVDVNPLKEICENEKVMVDGYDLRGVNLNEGKLI